MRGLADICVDTEFFGFYSRRRRTRRIAEIVLFVYDVIVGINILEIYMEKPMTAKILCALRLAVGENCKHKSVVSDHENYHQ